MVEDMIGHYQKLQDLDENVPEWIKKLPKAKKGEMYRGAVPHGMEYEV